MDKDIYLGMGPYLWKQPKRTAFTIIEAAVDSGKHDKKKAKFTIKTEGTTSNVLSEGLSRSAGDRSIYYSDILNDSHA